MIRLRVLLYCSFVFFVMNAAAAEESIKGVPLSHFSVFLKRSDSSCLRTALKALEPGIPIQIYDPDTGKPLVQAEIGKTNTVCADPDTDTTNLFGYNVVNLRGRLPVILNGIAVINPSGKPNATSLPKSLSLSACSSSDGAHLAVWAGKARTSRRLWHAYVYLNEDQTPDCLTAETR